MSGDVLGWVAQVVLSSLGSAGLLALFLKHIVEYWTARLLERDRAAYRKEVEEALHLLRDRMERGQFVHRLQFEAEFKAYLELWDKLVRAKIAALYLRAVPIPVSMDISTEQLDRQRLEDWNRTLRELQEHFDCHEPFLAPEVYESVKELAGTIRGQGWDFQDWKRGAQSADWNKVQENAKLMEKHAQAICQAIRKRIGTMSTVAESANAATLHATQ